MGPIGLISRIGPMEPRPQFPPTLLVEHEIALRGAYAG
jgi:hypothetical protein